MCDYRLHAWRRSRPVGDDVIPTTSRSRTSPGGWPKNGRGRAECLPSVYSRRRIASKTDVKYDHRWTGKRERAFNSCPLPQGRTKVSHQHHDATNSERSMLLITLLSKSPRADGAAVARQPSRTRYNLANATSLGRDRPSRRHTIRSALRSCSEKTKKTAAGSGGL